MMADRDFYDDVYNFGYIQECEGSISSSSFDGQLFDIVVMSLL